MIFIIRNATPVRKWYCNKKQVNCTNKDNQPILKTNKCNCQSYYDLEKDKDVCFEVEETWKPLS
jgi:hypothetical protein